VFVRECAFATFGAASADEPASAAHAKEGGGKSEEERVYQMSRGAFHVVADADGRIVLSPRRIILSKTFSSPI